MSATEQTICFKITGEYLTDLTRSLYADEGEPSKAIKILKDAFPEMPDSQIFSILSGEKKLIGDSSIGMDLVDDQTKKSKHGNELGFGSLLNKLQKNKEHVRDLQAVNDLYSGNKLVLSGSPFGLVQIPANYLEALRRNEIKWNDVPRRLIRTTSQTIHDPFTYDFHPKALRLDKDGETIVEEDFKPISAEIYRLDEDDESVIDKPQKESAQKVISSYQPLSKNNPLKKAINSDNKEFDNPYKGAKSHNEISSDNGWLLPDGKFYECFESSYSNSFREHIDLADALGYDEKDAEKLGWIKISRTIPFQPDRHITQRQFDRLFDYCQKTKQELPWWAKDNEE
jgi:hypothetical protein